MPHFDRFDIVDAHQHYYAMHHSGQWSPEYARLCRISTYYDRGPIADPLETDNAREIYAALRAKHGHDTSRERALAAHLETTTDNLEPCVWCDNTFECESAEYRVLTDSEADSAADESLDFYIDDCGILDSMPENLRFYFDRDAWKRDALISDGRGHILAGYDSDEHEAWDPVTNDYFLIYRIN